MKIVLTLTVDGKDWRSVKLEHRTNIHLFHMKSEEFDTKYLI